MNKKIIVFAAHPDDETLGCGGTIAKRISEGYQVLIVVMTDGRHAFTKVLNINSDPSPEELKEVRREEIKKAVRILGVSEENIIFLGFEDGKLEENSEKAKEKVTQILKENSAEEVFFHYYGKGVSRDHCATNQIVSNSIEEEGFPTLKYQYMIYVRHPIGSRIVNILAPFFKCNRVQVDISKFLPQKERALKEFKSQITIISSKQDRPVLPNSTVQRHLRNKETFYIDKKLRRYGNSVRR